MNYDTEIKVRLDDETKKQLAVMAEKNRGSISQLARLAIDEYIARHNTALLADPLPSEGNADAPQAARSPTRYSIPKPPKKTR